MWTYNFMFYLHADERLATDCNWKSAYTVVALPLVRNMIDCLYNITLILQDPKRNGTWFRLSGYRQMQTAIDEDEKRYGGQPEFDAWIAQRREGLDMSVRAAGFGMADVAGVQPWPTLGKYTKSPGPGATFFSHQQFLQTFVYGHWRHYSAIAHATFSSLADVALPYVEDSLSLEERSKIDEAYPRIVCTHLTRVAAVLLCIVTELQSYFKFDDNVANINENIHKMWDVLMPLFDVKELYEEHYKELMQKRGINP